MAGRLFTIFRMRPALRLPRNLISPATGALALAAAASAFVTLQIFGVGDGLTALPTETATASVESPAPNQFRSLVFKAKRPTRMADMDGAAREELACMALNIYFEARGEPAIGKLAVGHVVMNRVAAHNFPTSVCEVIRQGGEKVLHRCQFSWWCDGKSDRPRDFAAWEESLLLAEYILSGRSEDPTAGALWYHADYVSPKWRHALREGPTYGRHIFYTQKTKLQTPQLASSG